MRDNVKDFYGRIIGWRDVQANGNVVAHDFYGKILGNYDKSLNATKDFYGRILTTGDTTAGLILQADRERRG